ncbi:MAG: branched-chain amino acid ABC transporter permease [Proteobacteria bacterium]|nr:branched-chain amino acid ABC transporter permease [Pseudomonadota bacterium]NIS71662.1 branched-chain amino acid ABC transporter permease [Pseudomonadota bacterium]
MPAEDRRKERLDRGIKARTEGLYAISSWREITYLLAPRAALVLGLLIAPAVVPGLYWQRVLGLAGVYALLAISFDFLAERVGLVCIGGAFMIGVGGYISGVLNYYFHLPLALTIPVGTFGGALICTLLWLPCLPLRGIYFAVVTFMFPFLAGSIILAGGLFRGTEGLSPIAGFPNIWVGVYLIIVLVLFAVFALRRLCGEDIGLVFAGIKDNDQAVLASAINITRVKVYALFIATVIGCFAGTFVAHFSGFVGLSLFAIDFTIMPIAACVMGGPGTIAGPAVGAFMLSPLSELLRGFGQLRVVLYCLVLVGFILYKPEGLLNWATRRYHQFEHWVKL